MSGDKGAFDAPPDEVAETRRRECLAAAEVIGAEWIGLGVPDGTLLWNRGFHVRMIRAIQRADPDLILTHAPNDYMSDHTETSRAVTNASFYTVCPQFCTEGDRPTARVAPVYFMDTLCGVGFQPQEYVDITDTVETKLAMYAKHESQHRYLSQREGTAEGFRRYEAWPRLRCRRLLP